MFHYRDSKLVRIFLIIFFIAIAIYAYYEAGGILFGPTIQVPDTVQDVTQPYVEIIGTTTHIATLSIDGQGVPVTEAGGFDIPFALSPGFNRVVLDATDKYGHTTEKVLQIVYTPATPTLTQTAATTTPTATSTEASSTATSTR